MGFCFFVRLSLSLSPICRPCLVCGLFSPLKNDQLPLRLVTTENKLAIHIPLFGCNKGIDYLILFLRLVQCNILVNKIVLCSYFLKYSYNTNTIYIIKDFFIFFFCRTIEQLYYNFILFFKIVLCMWDFIYLFIYFAIILEN